MEEVTDKRVAGFINTPLLWNKSLLGIFNIDLIGNEPKKIQNFISDKLRLGNYLELICFHLFENIEGIDVLGKNIQIVSNKITLGEVDVLLLYNNIPIHLEIAYKFYLYFPCSNTNSIESWVGPNKRDSLLLKLHKIKEKQFPLLHKPETKNILTSINLGDYSWKQFTFFKGQLFLPYHLATLEFKNINKACLVGSYISFNQMHLFNDCMFYIPKKLDWLIIPYYNVQWISFKEAMILLNIFIKRENSPLVWVKHKNDKIEKVFVVWW